MQKNNRKNPTSLLFAGLFIVECYDKFGKLKWKKTAKNGTTNQGLDYALDILFPTVANGGQEKPAAWYVGLIRDDNFSTLAAGDTMASHAGWEEGDEYSETTRQEIVFDAASSQEVANTERCYFSINATETMKGAFVTNNNTKNGTAGKLFCTALFDGGDEAVVDGDILKILYTLTAAAA